MFAATLILPRFTVGWVMAVVAAALSVGLLLLAGTNLLPVAVLALAAVLVTVWQRLRAARRRAVTEAAVEPLEEEEPGPLVEVKTTAGPGERGSALDPSARS